MSVRTVSRNSRARRTRATSVRVLAALALGVCAALLASCGGSSKGLIPTSDAGPLQSDFEAVARAAEEGNGSCTSTESALLKTEQDFARLPSSVDSGLRETLTRGIENLRSRALALCTQPLPQATTQSTPKTTKTTTSTTTPPPTTSTETQTTSTPTTSPQAPPSPSGPGGGTQAPGEETHAGEAEGANPGGSEGSVGAGGAKAGGASFGAPRGRVRPGDGFGRGHGRHGGVLGGGREEGGR